VGFSPSFLGTGAMLVRAHNGPVDHMAYPLSASAPNISNTFFHTPLFRPAGKSRMNVDRVPEAFRQVTPGSARPLSVKRRLDKQPIVPGSHTTCPSRLGKRSLIRSH
jgi:hypothetical protein